MNCVEVISRDAEGLVMHANKKRFAMVMARDLNLHLNEGDRGRIMQVFCFEFSTNLVNEDLPRDDPSK